MAECEYCTKKCNLGDIGNAITIDFPYGSTLDSMFTPLQFCSHQCVIDYITKHEEEVELYRKQEEYTKKKGGD